MRVITISRDGNFYKIGANEGQARWYGVGDQVKKFIGTIQKNDDVNIKYQAGADGKPVLTYIKKSSENGGAPIETSVEMKISPADTYTKPTSSYSGGYKDPAVQESIKRQAIGHMTSRTLIALQAQLDVANVTGVMETIYAKYQELVG